MTSFIVAKSLRQLTILAIYICYASCATYAKLTLLHATKHCHSRLNVLPALKFYLIVDHGFSV